MAEAWLILGASSSIGRAFARLAAAGGCGVILAGRDAEDLEQSARDLRLRSGATVEVLAFDATDYDAHAGLVDHCFRQAQRINVLLLFGIMPPHPEMEGDWPATQRCIEVNFVGAASILLQLAPRLEAQGGGRVVVLSSVAGDRGRPRNYIYGSAKAGLNAFAEGLRARLHKSGVSLTMVKAGYLDTAMTFGLPGMDLAASPEACAKACLRAAHKGRTEIYFPSFWRPIMTVIKLLPNPIFKRLDF